MKCDETHDAELRSWIESANEPGCDFPIQNLPFGIFKRKDHLEKPRGESRSAIRSSISRCSASGPGPR